MAFRGVEGGKVVLGAGAAAVGGGLWYWGLWPRFYDRFVTTANKYHVDAGEKSRLDAAWAKLQATESNSLLKKHLTPSVYEALKKRKTPLNGFLLHVINSGVENPEASIGVYAPDPYAYKTFKELFDPIINEYHNFGPNDKHPATDLGSDKLSQLPPLDKEGKYIQSTRIRCGRTLDNFMMNSMMQSDDYLLLERKVSGALRVLDDPELQGKYYPLDGMTKKDQDQLIKDHFLFKDNDAHLKSAFATRFWPVGRGIFHNTDKTFLVWVGEEDHVRIISMEKGGDVGRVLGRLNRGIQELCKGMNLQVRGIHGEHSESEGGIYDISNQRRLGLTEFQAVKEMYDGVKTLIEMEKRGGK